MRQHGSVAITLGPKGQTEVKVTRSYEKSETVKYIPNVDSGFLEVMKFKRLCKLLKTFGKVLNITTGKAATYNSHLRR